MSITQPRGNLNTLMKESIVSDGQYLAVFNSTHRVMKAELLLKTNGLNIKLIPAPRVLQADCGLAIRFDEEQLDEIIKHLDINKLLPAFLCQMEHGTYKTIQEYQANENN